MYAALRPNSPLIGELAGVAKENLLTLPLRNALDAASARRLERYMRQHEIQILHAHMARDYPLASYATRRNPGSKLIITRHVLFPLHRLHSITLSQVARVIAVSGAVAREVQTQRLLPAERIVVVPNGIDLERFAQATSQTARNNSRRQWNIREDEFLIGTVGEITALKGHEEFLRAASIILSSFPQAKFLVAGMDFSRDRKNLAALETLIAQLNIGGSVQMIGWVEDLPACYGALDVFVSASHTESFGLAIAEAMAGNTPVVATGTEGAKEIIIDGESGVLVPVGDAASLAAAVIDLLNDENKRHNLAVSGRERIQAQFSLERMVEETERIFLEVLDE